MEDIYEIINFISNITLLNLLESCFLLGVIRKLVLVDNKKDELMMHLAAAIYSIKQKMNTVTELKSILLTICREVSANFEIYYTSWTKLNINNLSI